MVGGIFYVKTVEKRLVFCGPLNNILPTSTRSPSQVDAHEELYSMADDVFESPPMSASYGDHHEPYQSL